MQAVELAVSRAVGPERPRDPMRRLKSMRQTAAKAGSMVLGAGKFSAKVPTPPMHVIKHCFGGASMADPHGLGMH